ncbi:DUF6602 domain-containing protein [Sorangium sp. So ce295]|uniref:DUF6602 domain-containing protein n=1 Tax=Sorangium sp. So ce295 TaxID=3133295 RepID=UPI003F5EA432
MERKRRGGAAQAPVAAARYNDWFGNIVERMDQEFKAIRAVHNIERGEEFEKALCRALRALLPERAGVCRGYIVDRDNNMQGDDIIVYDAARFPTLRACGRDLAVKEQVPAEAVLAYIEAKHTLYAQEKVLKKHEGQSLAKACSQISAIKALKRAPMPLEAFAPKFLAPPAWFKRRRGFPSIRNPWYAAIWALNLNVGKGAEPTEALASRFETFGDVPIDRLPDVVAAGSVIMNPCVYNEKDLGRQIRPFVTEDTQIAFTGSVRALGLAAVHLIWAIEDIMLGDIPWPALLHDELAQAEQVYETGVVLDPGKSLDQSLHEQKAATLGPTREQHHGDTERSPGNSTK